MLQPGGSYKPYANCMYWDGNPRQTCTPSLGHWAAPRKDWAVHTKMIPARPQDRDFGAPLLHFYCNLTKIDGPDLARPRFSKILQRLGRSENIRQLPRAPKMIPKCTPKWSTKLIKFGSPKYRQSEWIETLKKCWQLWSHTPVWPKSAILAPAYAFRIQGSL